EKTIITYLDYNWGKSVHFYLAETVDFSLAVTTEPYIYIGKGNSIYFEGEKPITVRMELENEVPPNLYTEFTKKV
ncbi:hypothetical protein, partial [Fictibacillus gelatini]|uniref:hypothetical protein n=1 Tax=Fictibacillus gelatini TaxID=225985 RepID=UPI00055097A2